MAKHNPQYTSYLRQAKILYKNCYSNDTVGDGEITKMMLLQAQTSAVLAIACLLEDVFISSGLFAHVEIEEKP